MTLRAMYVAPLVAIGAVFAATGFADQLITHYTEPMASQSTMAPSDPGTPLPATEEATANPDAVVMSTEPEPASQAYAPAPAPLARPVAATADMTSTTTIYGERRTEDQFITDDVVKALAAEPRISGKVGVDTYRRVVTLTGRVSTQGQVDRITQVARRAVDRDVEIHNQVISKV